MTSQQTIAGLAAQGRHGDSVLVHMSPAEVRGIASLAPERLTFNPETGLPEMFGFKNLLPMIAGLAGTVLSGGNPAIGALASGATQTAVSGSLQSGIMTGLLSFGAMSALSGLAGAGAAAGAASAAAPAATAGLTGTALAAPAVAPAIAAVPAEAAASPFAATAFSEVPGGLASSPIPAGMGFPASPVSFQSAYAPPGVMSSIDPQLMAGTIPGNLPVMPADMMPQVPGDTGSIGYTPTPPDVINAPGAPTAAAELKPYDMFDQLRNAGKALSGPDAMKNLKTVFVDNAAKTTLPILGGGIGMLQEMSGEDEDKKKSDDEIRADLQRRYPENKGTTRQLTALPIDYRYGREPERKWFMAEGGLASLGGMVNGPGDGLSDGVAGSIEGRQDVQLADGEYVVSADVVSGIGSGSSAAGGRALDRMQARVRKMRTGTPKQPMQSGIAALPA